MIASLPCRVTFLLIAWKKLSTIFRVFATAELTKEFENIYATGSGRSLALILKLSRKRLPFDTRVLLQLSKLSGALTPNEVEAGMTKWLESGLLQ